MLHWCLHDYLNSEQRERHFANTAQKKTVVSLQAVEKGLHLRTSAHVEEAGRGKGNSPNCRHPVGGQLVTMAGLFSFSHQSVDPNLHFQMAPVQYSSTCLTLVISYQGAWDCPTPCMLVWER